MLSISNLKPKDLALLYTLLREEGLSARPAYSNIVKQLKKTMDAHKRMEESKNKPISPWFTNHIYGPK